MKVYGITLQEAKKLDIKFCERLFPNRLLRSRQFVKEDDRLRIIGAGALLHGALGIREQDIITGAEGKPYVPGSDIHFNISHSGDYAVLAVDSSPVGVDIEMISPDKLSIADSVFTGDELEWIEQDKLRRFFELWTIKESVLKAVGVGLSVDMRSFSALPVVMGNGIAFMNTTLYGKTITLGDCVLSACSHKEISSPLLYPIPDTHGSGAFFRQYVLHEPASFSESQHGKAEFLPVCQSYL